MQSPTSFFALALVAAALPVVFGSFNVPEDTPDGIYSAYTDTIGEDRIVRLDDPPSTLDTSGWLGTGRGLNLTRRDTPPSNPSHGTVWPKGAFHACNHRYMTLTDAQDAAAAFDYACAGCPNRQWSGPMSIFVKSGRALAYMCDYTKGKTCSCKLNEWRDGVDWFWRGCSSFDQPPESNAFEAGTSCGAEASVLLLLVPSADPMLNSIKPTRLCVHREMEERLWDRRDIQLNLLMGGSS